MVWQLNFFREVIISLIILSQIWSNLSFCTSNLCQGNKENPKFTSLI